jgi:hypothetical protein
MAEYEAARRMPAGSGVVFDIASDVERMDRWLPRGLWVRNSAPNTLEAVGELVPGEGRHEGLIDSSREQLRVEWGGRDHPGYSGWLQVSDSADQTSEVTVHLSMQDVRETPQQVIEVHRMLAESLTRLADEVDRQVSGAN